MEPDQGTRPASVVVPQALIDSTGGVSSVPLLAGRLSRTWAVAASPFLSKQLKEKRDSLFFPLEMMRLDLPAPSYPPPDPGKAGLAEERRRDIHRVVAGHVSAGIDPFNVEMIGLRAHEATMDQLACNVQRDL